MRLVYCSMLGFAVPFTVLLAACGPETSGTIDGEDGQTGEYSIDNSTGEATATISTEDGTATMRSGSDVPIDLPAGFTAYPGAEIVSNTVFERGAGAGALLTMTTNDSPEQVAEFYKAQAQEAGIDIQMDMTTNGNQMIGGESPDGLTFSVTASPAEEGTSVQLAVGSAPD